MASYVVFRGKTPGIYDSWDACEEQVKGFSGAKYKKYKTLPEAEAAASEFARTGQVSGASSGKTHSAKAEVLSPMKQEMADFFAAHKHAYEVYTDGGVDQNGRQDAPGGFGYLVLAPDKTVYAEGFGYVKAGATNQNMELLGAIFGIHAALKGAEIVFLSDMKDLYEGIAITPNRAEPKYYAWQRRGFRNNQNVELIEKLLEVASGHLIYGIPRPQKSDGTYARIAHASSQKDESGKWPYPANRIADALATMGKRASESGEDGRQFHCVTTSTRGTIALDGTLVRLIHQGTQLDERALFVSGREPSGYGFVTDANGERIETV